MSSKVIASTTLARELVKNGFIVIDIKPHKHDKKRTVHVFEDTEKLQDFINSFYSSEV